MQSVDVTGKRNIFRALAATKIGCLTLVRTLSNAAILELTY